MIQLRGINVVNTGHCFILCREQRKGAWREGAQRVKLGMDL